VKVSGLNVAANPDAQRGISGTEDFGAGLKARQFHVALALALFPVPAWANSGIGFLMVTVPAVIISLLPVIFIEAPVLARMLGVPLRRGLALSAGANFHSTWLGALIALGVDIPLVGLGGGSGFPPNRAVLVFTLLPMFFITWWIELRAIAGKLPEVPRPRVRRAVLVANLVSYAALVAMIVLTPLFIFYDQMSYRDRLYSTVYSALPWQRKVEEYFTKHKRLPERSADIGVDSIEPRREVRAMSVQAGGVIVLELRFPGDDSIDGKRLVFTPVVSGEAISGWRCRAPDLPRNYTPGTCRDPQ